MRLFSIDNPVIAFLVKILDCILLSILWVVFSLPIGTIGASSAAMYTTMYKYIRKDEGHLWSTFWGAFKDNLRRSTIVWSIALLIQALLFVDGLVFQAMLRRGDFLGRLYWFILVLFCVSMVWVTYMTAYAARFTGTVKDVLKIGVFLLLMHPLSSFGILLVILAMLALIITFPGLLMILPSVACLLCSMIMEKVFLQHMSEEDVKKTIGEEDKE